jgi:hypothetical protein
MSTRRSLRWRGATWCAADDASLRCGTGPLARYVYVSRLLVHRVTRLARLLRKRIGRNLV